MTAGRALYLRMPVSACTAEIRELDSAGGVKNTKGAGVPLLMLNDAEV